MTQVLVIDDDPEIRELVCFKLRASGFDVSAEPDGEAGLAAVEQLRPDVVVVDWMMPRLGGLEVCRAIRARPDISKTAIILLTAKGQEADIQRGFAAGADDYVVKPFSPRELVSRVEALLARTA